MQKPGRDPGTCELYEKAYQFEDGTVTWEVDPFCQAWVVSRLRRSL